MKYYAVQFFNVLQEELVVLAALQIQAADIKLSPQQYVFIYIHFHLYCFKLYFIISLAGLQQSVYLQWPKICAK